MRTRRQMTSDRIILLLSWRAVDKASHYISSGDLSFCPDTEAWEIEEQARMGTVYITRSNESGVRMA